MPSRWKVFQFTVVSHFWKEDVKTVNRSRNLKIFSPNSGQRHIFWLGSEMLQRSVCFWKDAQYASEAECVVKHCKRLLIPLKEKEWECIIVHLFIPSILSKRRVWWMKCYALAILWLYSARNHSLCFFLLQWMLMRQNLIQPQAFLPQAIP